MNTSPASVLPLTAIAFLFTPRQWQDWFGFDGAMEILQAQRQAKCRRDVRLLKDELEPVGYDGFGAPIYRHGLGAVE